METPNGLVDLSKYKREKFCVGKDVLIRIAWYCINSLLFSSWFWPQYSLKRWLLRLFGAQVGIGVVIKPRVNIKYPWNLRLGDYCWLGEGAWVDNLTLVAIGDNVCVSQGAYLCTGNHDWSDPHFALSVEPITLLQGAWVGARAIICPGVQLGEYAVVAAGSVVTKSVPAFEIHAGNPASFIRRRQLAAKVCSRSIATRTAGI